MLTRDVSRRWPLCSPLGSRHSPRSYSSRGRMIENDRQTKTGNLPARTSAGIRNAGLLYFGCGPDGEDMASVRSARRRSGTVYLLHYSGRTAAGHQHYLGWTTNLTRRLARHRAGLGARETKKAVEEGLKLKLAQSWRGTLADERRIKEERKAVKRGLGCLCPYCRTDEEEAAELLRGMGPPELRVRSESDERVGCSADSGSAARELSPR